MAIMNEVPRIENPFGSLCKELVDLQRGKGGGYTISPINELPMDAWLAQIQIKATRAKYANTPEKMEEELRDTMVYCGLAILKNRGIEL